MRSLIRLMTSSGAWRNSPYSGLPEVARGDTELARHYLIIAGGLALILSRASSVELAGGLAATQELHEQLRRELRLGSVEVAASLLAEALREVDELADPRTRASLRHCYEVQAKRALKRKRRAQQRGTTPSSLMGARSSQRADDPDQEAATVISSDVFDQRSRVLRKSVKQARDGAGPPTSQL